MLDSVPLQKSYRMNKILGFIFCALVVNSYAQNWTGNVSGDWNNSANWSSWPLNGEDITINPSFYTGNAIAPTIAVNSVFSPAAILIENGGVLTIGANLTTSDDVEVIGFGSHIEMNAGLFRVNPGDGGRLIIDLAASMTINGGNTNVDERFIAGEDALVTINSGIVSSGERLIMDLGGRFIQHDGVVSVGATFAMADGSVNYNSSYELNGGTLTITGEMAFENEFGNFEPTFIQNGGDMIVDGNVFWFGETPGLGTPRWLVNNGTAEVTGIIENMPLSTVNMYLRVGGSAEFNFSGTTITTLYPEDTIQLMGTSVFNFESNCNFNNAGVLNGILGQINVNSNVNFNGTGVFQINDVIISNLGTLNHVTASDLKIKGDWTKNGTFTTNNNTVVFNGSDIQAIGGLNTLSLVNMSMDNTHLVGVVLGLQTEYSGHLQLNDGILHTSTLNSFTAKDNATASSGLNASYVSGPMRKIGNDAFVFPIGKNQLWRRLGMSAPQNVTDVFVAEYFHTGYTSITPVNSPLSSVSNIEYWDFNQSNGTSPVEIDLYWEDATASGITDCGELSIAHWNGSSWDNVLSTASGICSGNSAGTVGTNSTTNLQGAFTFGFYSGVTSQNVNLCFGEEVVVGTNTYNQAGSYIDILQDINLNDSIVLTNVSVTTPNTAVNVITAGLEADQTNAQGFRWLDCANNSQAIIGETNVAFLPLVSGTYALEITQNGCVDTSDCIDVLFVDTVICSGDVYTVGINTYTSAGDYIDELVNIALLDSIVFSTVSITTINTTVSIVNYQLQCQNTTADSYSWIDCTTNVLIPNETSSVYAPTLNGSYKVIVSENGCSDTSTCILLNTLELDETVDQLVQIFPNPAQDHITISGVEIGDIVELRNILGESVITAISENEKMRMNLINVPAGIYFININDILMGRKIVVR